MAVKLKDKVAKLNEWAGDTGDSIKAAADTAGQAIKKAGEDVGRSVEAHRFESDRKALRPVFATDIETMEKWPALVRIVEPDKKRLESKACAGAIGYYSTPNGVEVLNVFNTAVAAFGLSFYPDEEKEVFFNNPSKKGVYIGLDEYFDYMRKARVDELEMIAHDLGAKHVRIEFSEHRKAFSEIRAKGKAKAGMPGMKAGAEAAYEHENRSASALEVATEISFEGNNTPVMPNLVYFRNDDDIRGLIDMRILAKNPIKAKSYVLKSSKSVGMSENTAVKIEGAMKKIGVQAGASIVRNAREENAMILKYSIEF